jgi:septin 7
MRDALEKQRMELEDKKRRLESGRPLTPEKQNVSAARSVWPIIAHTSPPQQSYQQATKKKGGFLRN